MPRRESPPGTRKPIGEQIMENFVLAGKARTVFRLLELKLQQEEKAKRNKKAGGKKRK